MTKLLFLLTILSMSFLHCDEPIPTDENTADACPNARTYQMKDLTGLDACGWMLVSNDQNYEVINLADFFDTFEEGATVMVELKLREDLASACQAGMITEIVCKP